MNKLKTSAISGNNPNYNQLFEIELANDIFYDQLIEISLWKKIYLLPIYV